MLGDGAKGGGERREEQERVSAGLADVERWCRADLPVVLDRFVVLCHSQSRDRTTPSTTISYK